MARKLMISEAFKDAKKEVVSNVRLSDTLYKLITEDAKDQGISFSTLVRDLVAFHYVLEHLKINLENNMGFEGGDIAILESFRAYVSEIANTLIEVDDIRQAYDDQRANLLRKNLHLRGSFEDRRMRVVCELTKTYGPVRPMAVWSDRIIFKSKLGIFEVGYSIDGETVHVSKPLELTSILFPKEEAEAAKRFFSKKSFRDFQKDLLKKESGKKGGKKWSQISS